MPPVDFEHVFLSHRALADEIMRALAKQYRLSSADAEDFMSVVHLRLIENDYAILRAFQGRSEWSTYLFAVIRRTLQDWLRARWGRWRPSVVARRLGASAMALERLIYRDGRRLDEAIDALRAAPDVTETVEQLRAIAAQLPIRVSRLDAGDADLDALPAGGSSPDGIIEAAEAAGRAAHVTALVQTEIARLPAADQLLLRLRFEEGLTVKAIAGVLGESPKPLYRRYHRLFDQLRHTLQGRGVSRDMAASLLQDQGFDHHE